MIKKLIAQWEAYVGPKDERIVAEENRLYSRLAKALIVITLVAIYYGMALRRAAGLFGDSALGSKYMGAFPPELILSFGIIITCTMYTTSLTRQGVIANNRFADVDTCPTSYFALCALLAAVVAAIGCFAVESFAQVQFVGPSGVYWVGNLAIGVFLGWVVFVGSFISYVLTYRDARKNRQRIDRELEG